jgi:hypothetical protein
MIDWLVDYLRFYVPLKNISLLWRRHHCRWRAAKFRPMLGAQGLWAGRDLYHATPAVTLDLGFSGLIRRTTHLVTPYDTWRDVEDLFSPRSSQGWHKNVFENKYWYWMKYNGTDFHLLLIWTCRALIDHCRVCFDEYGKSNCRCTHCTVIIVVLWF